MGLEDQFGFPDELSEEGRARLRTGVVKCWEIAIALQAQPATLVPPTVPGETAQR